MSPKKKWRLQSDCSRTGGSLKSIGCICLMIAQSSCAFPFSAGASTSVHFLPTSFRHSQRKYYRCSSQSSLESKGTYVEISNRGKYDSDEINIRQAEARDLKAASKILTDAFFSFNIFSTPVEWLTTFFSLQDGLVETSNLYYIIVACKTSSDSVVGICEVDNRLKTAPGKAPRPYICNLAVEKNFRMKGLGKKMIEFCEQRARDEWQESALHLRVRRKNTNAIDFYSHIGYSIVNEAADSSDEKYGDGIVLMKKVLS